MKQMKKLQIKTDEEVIELDNEKGRNFNDYQAVKPHLDKFMNAHESVKHYEKKALKGRL